MHGLDEFLHFPGQFCLRRAGPGIGEHGLERARVHANGEDALDDGVVQVMSKPLSFLLPDPAPVALDQRVVVQGERGLVGHCLEELADGGAVLWLPGDVGVDDAACDALKPERGGDEVAPVQLRDVGVQRLPAVIGEHFRLAAGIEALPPGTQRLVGCQRRAALVAGH